MFFRRGVTLEGIITSRPMLQYFVLSLAARGLDNIIVSFWRQINVREQTISGENVRAE